MGTGFAPLSGPLRYIFFIEKAQWFTVQKPLCQTLFDHLHITKDRGVQSQRLNPLLHRVVADSYLLCQGEIATGVDQPP